MTSPRFAPTDEQRDLREQMRRFLDRYAPEAEVRRLMETHTGQDPQLWQRLSEQFGLPGMGIPEQYGGLGLGLVEQFVVFEEAGRALLCAPLFSTVALAANALLACAGPAAQAQLLPAIAAGRTACLAIAEGNAVADRASATDDGWRLTGHADHVVDGASAELILVAAPAADGPALFAVEPTATGLTRTGLDVFDPTRKLARLTFDAVPVRIVGQPGAATETGLRRALDRAIVALAAEQVGGAQLCLELSVEHARTRIQFGRAIGSFQAVKHRCADMLVTVELARSAALYAAWAADHDPDDLAIAASLAKAACSDAYSRVTADTVQLHGGTGFTWEHRAHLYLKRATASAALLGGATEHRRRLADLLAGD